MTRARRWITSTAILAGIGAAAMLGRPIWIPAIGNSLVCTPSIGKSDALLIDNFDDNFLLFEEASALQQAGMAARTFVHVQASWHSDGPNTVSKRFVDVMAETAELKDAVVVPVRRTEPITLTVAYQIRDFFAKAGITSVLVVTEAFRSRRSLIVYNRILKPVGIVVGCAPVFGSRKPATWARSWHGVQEVAEQFVKLEYYRLYVMPFLAHGSSD